MCWQQLTAPNDTKNSFRETYNTSEYEETQLKCLIKLEHCLAKNKITKIFFLNKGIGKWEIKF